MAFASAHPLGAIVAPIKPHFFPPSRLFQLGPHDRTLILRLPRSPDNPALLRENLYELLSEFEGFTRVIPKRQWSRFN
jgi:hypothetical protein